MLVGCGMVVADAWTVAVPVGVVVGGGNSCSVGVFVPVLERSDSSWGVVVVSWGVSVGSGVASDVGSDVSGWITCVGEGVGDSVTEDVTGVKLTVATFVGVSVGVGVGVAVRQGPSVERARYCGHSSSWMRISRKPPGNDSQISLFCVVGFWEPGVDPDGCGVEVDTAEDATGDNVAGCVGDGKVVAVI